MLPDRDPVATVAAERPRAVAVEDLDTGSALSYAELDDRVSRVTTALAAHGVAAGDRVAIATGGGIPFVVSFHAVIRLGAVAAPVDPSLAGDRRRERLTHLGPAILIADQGPGEAGGDPWARATYDALVAAGGENGTAERGARSPAAVRCLMSTSGTTGRPRTVALRWENLVASALASVFRLGISPTDRWLTPLAPHHMGGLAPIVRSAVYGTTYLHLSADTAAIGRAIQDAAPTGLSVVPVMLRRLLDADAALADLRFVLVGGDRTPPALVERALDRGVPLFVSYGMTEAASQIATATPAELRSDPGTVGRPLRWLDVTIADPDADGLGEIVVDGPMVAAGYWREPDGTAARFQSSGFATGDEGRLTADGRLVVEGRVDDRIVTGGVTVDPQRIRDVLEAQPGVRAAAVVGIPDDEWGERVCALLAGEDPEAITVAEADLRQALGAAALPREIAVTAALPRTDSGTVDRAAVRRRFADAQA